jgi:hypothetical protein
MLCYASHHYSEGTKGGAVVEASWIRSVRTGFAFDEYRTTVPPVHANVAKVVGRLKAKTVNADSSICVGCYLSAAQSAAKDDRQKS